MNKKKDTEAEGVKYIGGGSYLPGVPARDLTPQEWRHHKKTILASPQATELYEIPEDESPQKPVEAEVTQESNGNG